MKISYNWIQEYLDFKLPPVDELVQVIGAQLGAVEEVLDLNQKYAGIVIVRIDSCQRLEDSDHLNICLIDDGGATPNVDRNEKGQVQVVCGAPNVRDGMLVAWLPPGSTVPSSFGKDPFVLGARNLRGVMSNGMLASPQELALGDSHDGILEVDIDCQPGTNFSEAYKLNDYIIDIENKMFTHRPDCFGILGIAREISGILGHQFTEPGWFNNLPTEINPAGPALPLQIRNEAPESVPRLMAVALSNVTIRPSSVITQTYLYKVGIRPINNIVDATNYFMYVTGQPLHAYDYDKVRSVDESETATIVARLTGNDETLQLLNGKAIKPRAGATVIATEQQVIGLAGVMGGSSTEVDNTTTNIILECATFEMYSIRRTSMVHGLFSEAVTRFNKGQSPYQNSRILALVGQSICEIAGAEFAGQLLDEPAPGLEVNKQYVQQITVSLEFINARLGSNFDAAAVQTLLTNVNFAVNIISGDDQSELKIDVPFWRTDIEIREDIVEEVGRLYGFDRLPLQLPVKTISPAPKNGFLELKSKIRSALMQAGANEVLTYSFVHGNLLDKVGQDKQQAYKISNALSPDLQYYRLSLTPSLLEKVHANIKAGHDQFAIFELGKAHIIDQSDDMVEDVPKENECLALVFTADPKISKQYHGASYYQAARYLNALVSSLGLTDRLTLDTFDPDLYVSVYRGRSGPYEVVRTAIIKIDDVVIGEIGEYEANVRKVLKLPAFTAGFEIDLTSLYGLANGSPAYQPLPKFPKTAQDICLRVPTTISYGSVHNLAQETIGEIFAEHSVFTVSPIDIFQREGDDDFKQITLRVLLANYQRTLTDAEVSSALDEIAKRAAEAFGAERV